MIGMFGRICSLALMAAVFSLWSAIAEAQAVTLNVAEARLAQTIDAHPAVTITLSPNSRKNFAKLTAEHIGSVLEVRIPSRVLMKARIRTAIRGVFQIAGTFSEDEAADLSHRISSDELKIEADIASDE